MESDIPIDNILLDRIYALHLTFADSYPMYEIISRIKNALIQVDKLQLNVIKLHMQLFYISNEQFEVTPDQLEQYFENNAVDRIFETIGNNTDAVSNNPFARFFNRPVRNMNRQIASSSSQPHSSYYVVETPEGVVMSFGNNMSSLGELDNVFPFSSSRTLNLPRGLNSLTDLLQMISHFYNATMAQQEDVKIVLKPEALQSIPKIKYDDVKNEISDITCTICQCDYEDGETLMKLPCDHFFHETCVSIWLGQQSHVCPICRKEAGDHMPLIKDDEQHEETPNDDNIINQIELENEEMDREHEEMDREHEEMDREHDRTDYVNNGIFNQFATMLTDEIQNLPNNDDDDEQTDDSVSIEDID